ncbi:unnamed protein product [Symbiodinium sp. CCMP2592]|nr:unnamed protein product [Symbiodinium sp. CCMP2592]
MGDIMDTLTQYCRDANLDPKRTYTWMCCFCINQHRVKETEAAGETVPFEEFKKAFGDRVKGIGKIVAMMAPWKDPFYIKRVWCDFEMYTATSEKQVTVQEVDAAAFHLLNADFKGANAFSEGANALCEKTVGVSRDALLQCGRLRLVARLAKVLRLLSQPGERLSKAARDWAKTPSVDALLEVRDIGLEEGPASSAASSDRVSREVFQAARKLSRDMLPKHGEEDPIEAFGDSQASTVPGEASPAESREYRALKRYKPGKTGVQGEGSASRGGPNIFDAPLVSEMPSFEDGLAGRPSNKRVHSFAQTSEGDTFVAQGGAPKARKEYSVWTEGEEQRLLEGFKIYGKQWAMISKCCGLQHRSGMQIKDKWRILQKNGIVPARGADGRLDVED